MKKVNKQLKSADFFFQMWKFQEIVLKKVLAFFVLMSKHTLTLMIHQHKGLTTKYWILSLPILLLFSTTSKPTCQAVWDQIDNVPCDQKWYHINQIKIFTKRLIGKISHFYKSPKKSKKFYLKTDQKFSVCRDSL